MKVGTIKKILKEDLAKFGKLEAWVEPFISTLNGFIEPVVRTLSNNLTFADNFACKVIEQKFTSGTAAEVSVPAGRRVYGILPVEALNKEITSYKFTRKVNGNISITLTWTGGGDAVCRVVILLE